MLWNCVGLGLGLRVGVAPHAGLSLPTGSTRIVCAKATGLATTRSNWIR